MFSHNQDEFFRVQVAEIRRLIMLDGEQGKNNGAAILL
ncbi:hypothetical protein [Oceanisphaera psychrotolerans]|nr:hypothetical protein [Oceanisphaera psychrotolerans]